MRSVGIHFFISQVFLFTLAWRTCNKNSAINVTDSLIPLVLTSDLGIDGINIRFKESGRRKGGNSMPIRDKGENRTCPVNLRSFV